MLNFLKTYKRVLALMGYVTVLMLSVACSPTSAPDPTGVESLASRAVLQRLTGAPLENFHFELIEDESANDWYEVTVKDNEVFVVATSIPALTYGGYSYLNDIGALSVSWEGSRVALPDQYENRQGKKTTSPFWQRVYLNVCAYGYTMPWWDWARWEKEIDWMAIHGVNTPVAMEGQEIVWQTLWKEFSITDAELSNYFSGPAFTAWHRMGNIEAHMGPLPQTWIDKKHELQTKILQRMRELGMEPVVPAFGGYVPKQFAEKYPDAKIYKMEPWTGFKEETYWLDPADPLFPKVAKRFIEIYTATYGESRYFLSDSFNEMLPPVSEENRYADLAAYGEAIFQSINQAAPGATWVMQGWMFGADKEFWDLPSIEAFLSKVPNDRAMIHDIANDRYDVWEDANAFYGKPWIFGYIHNYGGSNPVYGDFKFYHQQVTKLLQKNNTGNLSGFGVFPEGIHNNSVVYDYLFDVAWSGKTDSLDGWIKRYTNARYGHTSSSLLDAWKLLETSVFETKYWSTRWWEGSAGGYLLFKRPEARLTQFSGHPGDVKTLRAAVDKLLTIAPEYKDSPLFLYDLVDFYRHYLTQEIDVLLQQTIIAYQQGNIAQGDANFTKVTQLTEGLDVLLGLQQESLATWIDDAKAYGATPEESLHYVTNAKMQVTVWGGPKLKDYASKAWQGMYKDFYLPRWDQFFSALKKSATTTTPFDEEQVRADIESWERAWVIAGDPFVKTQPENPLALMASLLSLLDQ